MKRRATRSSRVLIAALLLIFVAASVFAFEYRCVSLLVSSMKNVDVPVPEGCSPSQTVPHDSTVEYLENERRNRGLAFESWITCSPLKQDHVRDFGILRDPRWLPSYQGQAYQFRRVVIIFPYAPSSPATSTVVAEVASVPWFRYISQVRKDCEKKFSAWR